MAEDIIRASAFKVGGQLYFELTLGGPLAGAIERAAVARGQSPADLVCDVLDKVFLEGLVRAVLDD